MVVAVDASGQLYFDGQNITEEKLRKSLAEAARRVVRELFETIEPGGFDQHRE